MGLRAHSYKLRTILLEKLYPRDNEPEEGNFLIDCNINIGAVTSNLLGTAPSLQETSTCSQGCKPILKKLRTIQLEPSWILDNDFYDVIEKRVKLKGSRKCPVDGCTGFVQTSLSAMGEDIFEITFCYLG